MARSSGVSVANSAGSATSNAATLTVVANRPPVVTIVTPTSGALYTGIGGELGIGDEPNGACLRRWEVVFQYTTRRAYRSWRPSAAGQPAASHP